MMLAQLSDLDEPVLWLLLAIALALLAAAIVIPILIVKSFAKRARRKRARPGGFPVIRDDDN